MYFSVTKNCNVMPLDKYITKVLTVMNCNYQFCQLKAVTGRFSFAHDLVLLPTG